MTVWNSHIIVMLKVQNFKQPDMNFLHVFPIYFSRCIPRMSSSSVGPGDLCWKRGRDRGRIRKGKHDCTTANRAEQTCLHRRKHGAIPMIDDGFHVSNL